MPSSLKVKSPVDQHVDKTGYDEYYRNNRTGLFPKAHSAASLIQHFETRLKPLHLGGPPRGYVRGQAVARLLDAVSAIDRPLDEIHVLDAGCGSGGLSVYLAAKGLRVSGVDVSNTAIASARELAGRVGVAERCHFLAESLENTSLEHNSVDFVIGVNSLHHFIKYDGVPGEFLRILKPGAEGWFADGFGENKLFHVFHDKEKMERLGDVILTEELVRQFFKDFTVTLNPSDWFTMLDRLNRKILPKKMMPLIRKLSALNFFLDRKISASSRLALKLSGSVVTHIHKLPGPVPVGET